MLLFGHTGIALGTVWLLQEGAALRGLQAHGGGGKASGAMAWLHGLKVDYRLLLLGSVLPDIIDKPLGHWIMGDTFSNGRIFAHTGLFFLILAIAGVARYVTSARPGLAVLSVGVFFHLLLDSIWNVPRTLFWPAYGWTFESKDLSNWLGGILEELVSTPGVYIPETIGALALALFGIRLIQRGMIRRFLRSGERP